MNRGDMGPRADSPLTRFCALAASQLLIAGMLALLAPEGARADSAPPQAGPANPTTVSADALPTVQINGVAWDQVAIGNTVYVVGSFTRARPAGAAAGQQESVRNHILAYDITTGALVTSFAPSLNAQALSITASPDGSRLYVGGDFTTVNGSVRNRVAALTPAGALVDTFRPSVNSQVRALAATNSTLYMGGSITAVGGVSRNRLAAVSTANGALLPWAPQPGVGPTSGNRDGNTNTSNAVMALVVTGGGNQVVAAGRFDSMNGVKATGVAALDPVSGANRPFAINQLITNQGVNSAIYSLSTDGTTVYGSGYDYYGPGNVEGNFAATADGGNLIVINDCRGDTYDTYPMHGALYVASHTHNCDSIGGQIEQNPRVEKRGTAYTTTPTTVVRWGTHVNWVGKPAGTQLAWNPEIASGTYTGQYQGSWSVTGNGRYVSYGGEFPRVNGRAQQGLVRFAMPDIAPNAVGPQTSGFSAAAVVSAPGVARISWRETWDYDNEHLTYRVFRDGGTTPIHTVTRASRWWNLEYGGFSDVGRTGTHSYRVSASDPFGNTVQTSSVSVTVPAGSATARPYAGVVAADGATDHWPLGEASGTTAFAGIGGNDLTVGSGVTRGSGGAISGDPNTATTFDGTSASAAAAQRLVQAPSEFSVEAWFRTTSTGGGKIVGFGNSNTGTSSVYDRHVYMDTSGRVLFGVTETNQRRVIQSGTGLNDGNWHHVVATLSNAGMMLYVDGVRVATRASTTVGPNYYGYWRVGGDSTWSGSQWFDGRIDEVAVYPTALSQSQVAGHHTAGTSGGPVNQPPSASFTATPTDLTVAVNAAASTDADGTITSYAWNWGDGSPVETTTGPSASHSYAAGGTRTITLTVRDDAGATGTTTRTVTLTAPDVPPVAQFTETVTGLDVAFDGGGSNEPGGGPLASWAWDFGDGSVRTSSGPTTSHTYAAGGTYTVTLTVTDDDGQTGTTSHPVTVSGTPGPAVLATDTFNRTVSGGLGTADVGGPWTVWQGGTRQSVSPGAASFALPGAGNNTASYLNGVSQTSAEVLTSFSVSSVATGSGTYVYVGGRFVATLQAYRVRVRLMADGRVALALSRYSDGGEAFPGGELIVPGLTYAPGTTLQARVLVTGTNPTRIAATVWREGTTEPSAPQMTWTDTTAQLQVPGGFSLMAHRPSNTTAATTVQFTSFIARVGP
ncbi:PKD domain-containing protein [Blastococcus sp. PRF04-17]|uniref:PKD domain-containing protein n=1 Tax=Blastococcus sp. PRF04-17 TaxID=2933797 RepID=UPI001FF1CA57|nr:PKD domain-containing protein [Blastococcus sp. PRF04-17]UOX99769.1 PKD domain-containing protein [Blastococcus sp. PRF04-17]